MTIEQALFIGAIKASVCGVPIAHLEEPDWNKFIQLACNHDLTAMAYDGLQKSNYPLPERVGNILYSSYLQAFYRDAQQEHIMNQLQSALVEAGIQHIFLKGSVLKTDYPIPALRTMCDLDVLVYAKDFDRIADVVKTLGGTAISGDGNHRNFEFAGGVFVEFHPNLLHHAAPIGTGLNPGWQNAEKDSPTCSGELTAEGFYLNTVCHLADHFVEGSIGVRFLLDVWVNRHLRKSKVNRSFVEMELNRFGLLDFVQNIEQLADAWFGDLPMTPLLEELSEYVLASGMEGIAERAMINAMSLSSGASRSSVLWKKAFYPRAELEDRFPWCKGKPLLLPAAWCCRAYNAVTQHGSIVVHWMKGTGEVCKADVIENREMLQRFGIYQTNKRRFGKSK